MLTRKAIILTSFAFLLSSSSSSLALADTRDVVHDEATGTIAHSSSGQCVRTRWMNGSDVCADTPAAATGVEQRHAASLTREERIVYFDFNEAKLSPQMMERLDTISNVLRSDSQVKGARIVGYADRIGNPSYNEALSKKRADNVNKYLESKGLLNTQVADIRWLGSSVSATDCSSNMNKQALISCLQEDRRVEVEIDFAPDLRASK